jgi:DNA-binding CsgD family transcriptional regulator
LLRLERIVGASDDRPMSAGQVVGREAELAAIRSLVSLSRGGVVLTGEAGIGKTVLWELGVEFAADSGSLVLRHQSVRAETGFAFSGLADLLGPVVDEVLPLLAAPRRKALEVALLLAEPDGDAAPDAHAVGLAVLDTLRALARKAPVAIAIDDVQWLDASSASVLDVALRRLRDEAVLVLATMRSDAEPVAALGVEILALEPLDLTGVHRLVRDRLDMELPRPTLAAIHRASGGNPYFALELARNVTPGETLRVPESLRELLGERIDRLPRDVLDVLLDVAVLAQPTVMIVAGGREQPDAAYSALATAAHEGIVRIEGERIAFAHPLLASLCYDRALPWERRAAHRRLAQLVGDPEERARHLALAAGDEPDAELARDLEAAGHRAASRGATAAAAELLELAVRHTPAADQRRRRRLAAARLHRVAGDLERAAVLYRDVLRELRSGPARSEVLHALALTTRAGVTERMELAERALEEVGDDDGLAAQLLGYLALNRWAAGQSAVALADARAGLARAERVGAPPLVAGAIGPLAFVETWRMECTPGLLERGVELERSLREPVFYALSPSYALVIRLIVHDRTDEAKALIDRLAADAERRGDEHARTQWALLLINAERFAGRPDRALAHAETTRDLAGQIADTQLRIAARSFIAGALAEVGRVEEAMALATEGIDLARSLGDRVQPVMMLGILGRIELVRGNASRAHELLDPLPQELIRQGHLHPAGMPWPDAIEAAVAVGRTERAQELLGLYEPIAARASCWARASAARCAGLIALAEGDDGRAVAAFERGLQDERGTHPLERGRILTALGMSHRHARRHREARAALERAVALLDEVGAAAWRDEAAAELRRISGRRGHGDELTPSELRVAELAAEGHQNKEIATELFLSVATVEAHLTRIYRKLGVRSRTELAHALPKDPGAASNV